MLHIIADIGALKQLKKFYLQKLIFTGVISCQKRTFKTHPVWAGLTRDVDGGTIARGSNACNVCRQQWRQRLPTSQ